MPRPYLRKDSSMSWLSVAPTCGCSKNPPDPAIPFRKTRRLSTFAVDLSPPSRSPLARIRPGLCGCVEVADSPYPNAEALFTQGFQRILVIGRTYLWLFAKETRSCKALQENPASLDVRCWYFSALSFPSCTYPTWPLRMRRWQIQYLIRCPIFEARFTFASIRRICQSKFERGDFHDGIWKCRILDDLFIRVGIAGRSGSAATHYSRHDLISRTWTSAFEGRRNRTKPPCLTRSCSHARPYGHALRAGLTGQSVDDTSRP
ncbi:hypothetical protein DFH08DRAFT_91707 [Mycena albidolilacea]|uniref:Uncharacterized protein n=1 Tax=Mycena albidolilacea TaxID=1033008 RepID=A0AAD7A9F3_9AGAR|nr:hypothetical protein DFH08DRAFT_91707 [Mycena albidolilacea]